MIVSDEMLHGNPVVNSFRAKIIENLMAMYKQSRELTFSQMLQAISYRSGYAIPDTPQFRGGNPYFVIENLYQSVSFIYASIYLENVHAVCDAVCKKIATLCNKNR